MSPHLPPQSKKLMRLNLPHHLRRAVPKAMDHAPAEDVLTVLFYSLEIRDLSWFLHLSQTLAALIMVPTTKICNYWNKIWTIALRKELVHKPQVRTRSEPVI
jgi:hypothetical protein